MKTGLFWKVVVIWALVLMTAYTGLQFRGNKPVFSEVKAGGGAVGNVIALTSDAGNISRLFLVNPDQKTILVYQTATNTDKGARLLCGRAYGIDEETCTYGEIEYNPNGYTLPEVKALLDKAKARAEMKKKPD